MSEHKEKIESIPLQLPAVIYPTSIPKDITAETLAKEAVDGAKANPATNKSEAYTKSA